MNLRQMEVFRAIMRAGSVTGAAKLLNVTQPAISAVLSHCEDQLKIPLFERSKGRLIPTAEAKAIYPDIDDIFQRVESVSRVAADLAEGRLGGINLAASISTGSGLLPEVIARFQQRNPLVRVSLKVLPTAEMVNRVSRREADLAIGVAPINNPGVSVETLVIGEVCCVMSETHHLAKEPFLTPEKLAQESVITYDRGAPVGRLVEATFAEAGVPLTRGPVINQSMPAVLLAAKSAGVAVVEPMFQIANMRGLVVVPLHPAIHVHAALLQPVGQRATLAIGAFIETLRETIAESMAAAQTQGAGS